LLQAIEILINDPVWARYPYASVTEAMTRFMTCRQLENKPLADYVKRFKSYQDSMAQNMGMDFLKDFVKNTKQYADETDTDKQDVMKCQESQRISRVLHRQNDGEERWFILSILMMWSVLVSDKTLGIPGDFQGIAEMIHLLVL
jgi:hypothetical protein